ncbi:glycerate kinase [Alkalibacillus aidingensis]|uniref:glycerate kinase n=1 Tax=Alkalibacillus aidingensis TaxID=2747607 RepID=UPI0016615246|nr:glycerate kinase [Alkalibacillus aidingensis]
MNITIAPDSFKGSLTANQASDLMEQACLEVNPSAIIRKIPMADGGEGTIDSLIYSTNGKRSYVQVSGPLGDTIEVPLGESGIKPEAYIEVASVCGLVQVPKEKRDPLKTSSYGLGELIKIALDKGYRRLMIGLGGSATNDGGLGMLQALGAKFMNRDGTEVGRFGEDLFEVASIDFTNLDKRLNECEVVAATDVNNPLCGENGASFVFGPQKGAGPEVVNKLDHALNHYSDLVEDELNQSFKWVEGSGAAGGIGFSLLVVGATISSGAEIMGDLAKLEQSIKTSDLVLTGEGKSDVQTFFGKVPGFTAKLANKYGIPCVLISGAIDDQERKLHQLFTGVFSIVNEPMSFEECMTKADELLYFQTVNVIHFYQNLLEEKES